MQKTKIEWTDATWNPVTGCLHGCAYCYARGIARRFSGRGAEDADGKLFTLDAPRLRSDESYNPYPFGFLPTLHKYRLGLPQEWTKPQTVFVCSMADLFGAWVPDEWIAEAFAACEKAPQHRYLFLTKNPERYCKLADAGLLPHKENMWYGSSWTKNGDAAFPGGVGTINDRFNTFLSMEPLLEGMASTKFGFGPFNWIILGAETGNRKGKVKPEKAWIDDITTAADRCGIPAFMKDSLLPIVGAENMRRAFPWSKEAEK